MIRHLAFSVVSLMATLRVSAVAPNVELLSDGRMNPACVWQWEGKPIDVVTDFGEEREIGGVRIMSGRSWVNCCVKQASFYAITPPTSQPVLSHVRFRPANTYKELYATWKPVRCRGVKMVIEDTYDFQRNYYSYYTHVARRHLLSVFGAPSYPEFSGPTSTVQIAELKYFGAETPGDLPLPNADPSVAYPDSRLVRDWAFQSCAVSNVSHCASVEPDTTRPDPLGEDISTVVTDAAWKARRREMRREFLAAFRADVPEFVYVKHLVMGNSIMHATDDMTDASYVEWKSVPDYKGGSQLIRARLEPDGSVTQEVLVDEPLGIIRDPAVSFDGKTLLFAKRRTLERDDYHLWTFDLETRRLTQITFGETMGKDRVPGQTNDFTAVCSDIEPCWLPDGSIMFQSTRCAHSVDCWPLPVSNLFRCDADGKNVRRIGFDQVQTFFPQLMPDGRVSYTRWEYNDRNTAMLQNLMVMNPDGTRQTALWGCNSDFPVSILHARGIPGSDKVMAISSGHHVAQKGRLVELQPSAGDDFEVWTYDQSKALYEPITNGLYYADLPGGASTFFPTPWDGAPAAAVPAMPGGQYLAGAAMDLTPGRSPLKTPRTYQYNAFDMHTQFGPQWAYPHPLDTNRFLVSFMPEGCRYYRGPYSSRFGVYAMTADGRRELLAFDWGNHCLQPVPLKPRPRPKRVLRKPDYRKGFGICYVQDVYEGLPMKGVARGTVDRLRVVALEWRPVHNGWNWQFGYRDSQGKIGTPIAVGNGAYDVKHVLGEAEVEADGSCAFLVPARCPVYFQLVDKKGCVIQTMRSWATLQPDERNSCIGCHEHPNEASVSHSSLALSKPPQRLKPCLATGERHPILDILEKEGPLSSLSAWMGVNRPRGTTPETQGDGFSFRRRIQPILDRSCVGCHREGSRIDLSDAPARLPATDDKSFRVYTRAYLTFSEKGACTTNVNFSHGLAGGAFMPPYTFGSARSRWHAMLAAGHPSDLGNPRVSLSDRDLRTIAMWIDLCVPFGGSYFEGNRWDAWHLQRFLYTYDKRIVFYAKELNEIRASLGLPPAPLDGFVPNVTEPRKQRSWQE